MSTSNTSPFNNLRLSQEPYYLYVRALPDQWPMIYSTYGAGSFSVEISTNAGEPVLRGNPFIYSWGGTGTNGTAGTAGTTGASVMWPALDPASVYAKLTTYEDGAVDRPQFQLFGNRRYPGIDGSPLEGSVSPVKSRVSIYDFLRPFSSTKKIFVTISGSFLAGHQTANDAAQTGGIDPTP
jgi:hypothetical protein